MQELGKGNPGPRSQDCENVNRALTVSTTVGYYIGV